MWASPSTQKKPSTHPSIKVWKWISQRGDTGNMCSGTKCTWMINVLMINEHVSVIPSWLFVCLEAISNTAQGLVPPSLCFWLLHSWLLLVTPGFCFLPSWITPGSAGSLMGYQGPNSSQLHAKQMPNYYSSPSKFAFIGLFFFLTCLTCTLST